MRILTWNLFHGRAVPPAGRDLFGEYAATLAGWEWDVALLQEVPPWWPADLGRACAASARMVLTSRNELPALRRAIAIRAPDLIKSNGGGANAILVRGQPILGHRTLRLRWCPERRAMHAVRLREGWIANLHAQVHSEERAQADLARAGAALTGWAAGDAVVLGGDTNTRAPRADGFVAVGGRGVDHVLARGLVAAEGTQRLERRHLSDHDPLLVTLRTS